MIEELGKICLCTNEICCIFFILDVWKMWYSVDYTVDVCQSISNFIIPHVVMDAIAYPYQLKLNRVSKIGQNNITDYGSEVLLSFWQWDKEYG